MTEHLSQIRLLALACGEAASVGENGHLRTCNPCACALAEERALSAALEGLIQPLPPQGFASRVTSRFAQAVARRRRIHAVASCTLAFVGAVLFVPWLLLAGPGMLTSLSTDLARAAVVVKALSVAATSSPVIPQALMILTCSAVVLWATLLGRLAHARTWVK